MWIVGSFRTELRNSNPMAHTGSLTTKASLMPNLRLMLRGFIPMEALTAYETGCRLPRLRGCLVMTVTHSPYPLIMRRKFDMLEIFNLYWWREFIHYLKNGVDDYYPGEVIVAKNDDLFPEAGTR